MVAIAIWIYSNLQNVTNYLGLAQLSSITQSWLTIEITLKYVALVFLNESFYCLQVTHFYTLKEGVRTLKTVRLNARTKSKKNILSFYSVNIK